MFLWRNKKKLSQNYHLKIPLNYVNSLMYSVRPIRGQPVLSTIVKSERVSLLPVYMFMFAESQLVH